MPNIPSLCLTGVPPVQKEDDEPGDRADEDGTEEGEQEVPGVGGGVQVRDGQAGVGPGVEAVYCTTVDSTGVVPTHHNTKHHNYIADFSLLCKQTSLLGKHSLQAKT